MNIFTFKAHGNYDRHSLITDMNEEEANELIKAGAATEIDMTSYKIFEDRANEAHKELKDAEYNIKNTDNPLLQSPDVQAYELDKIRKDFEEKTATINAEYEAYRSEAIEKARKEAAQATITISDKDKATAEQVKNRLNLRLATTGDKDMATVVDDITNEIALLSDAQKTSLQSHVPELLAHIKDESVRRKLVDEVSDVRNMSLLGLRAAEQLPLQPSMKTYTESIIRGWRK